MTDEIHVICTRMINRSRGNGVDGFQGILLLRERRPRSLGRIERLNKVNISIVERRPTKKSSVLAQSETMHRRLRRCSCIDLSINWIHIIM